MQTGNEQNGKNAISGQKGHYSKKPTAELGFRYHAHIGPSFPSDWKKISDFASNDVQEAKR